MRVAQGEILFKTFFHFFPNLVCKSDTLSSDFGFGSISIHLSRNSDEPRGDRTDPDNSLETE